MTTTPLDAELSGIAIIDGLSPAERAKHGDTRKLEATISGASPELLGPTYFCDSKAEYWRALQSLVALASSGTYYMLHLECHGCPDGIQIGSDVVTWSEQASELATLNTAMRGQLVINVRRATEFTPVRSLGLILVIRHSMPLSDLPRPLKCRASPPSSIPFTRSTSALLLVDSTPPLTRQTSSSSSRYCSAFGRRSFCGSTLRDIHFDRVRLTTTFFPAERTAHSTFFPKVRE